MIDEKNTDSNIKLPAYLKLLDNFMILGVLIPIFCWLFLIFYFKQLPPPEYKYKLNFIWFSVSLFILPTILVGFFLTFSLKNLGIKVYGPNQYTGASEILPVKKLYEIVLHTAGIKRVLVGTVVYIKLSISFLFGWGVLGVIILFFATTSHM